MYRLAKGFNIQVLVSTMHLIYKAEFSSRHPALTRWYKSNVIDGFSPFAFLPYSINRDTTLQPCNITVAPP